MLEVDVIIKTDLMWIHINVRQTVKVKVNHFIISFHSTIYYLLIIDLLITLN